MSFRPQLLACLVFLSGLQVTRPSESALAAERPPNIVLILADDLGWSDLGCYGADLHETPHLDRLARQGIRFTQAYAASVCSPTRAALLTGRHYARLHVTIWYEAAYRPPQDRQLIPPVSVNNLPHSEITLATRLQAAGYLTAIVGKWHLGDARHYPETHGFDVNIGGTLWGAPQSYWYPYRGSQRFEGERRYVPGLQGGRKGEYLTDRLTDEALKVIDLAGERPFFLYLAHHAVHTPIEARPELIEHYRTKVTPGMNHQNVEYAAMLHSLDQSVGRVLDRLDQRGLAENTVVVFLSDNGGHIRPFAGQPCTNNFPLRSGKGSLYEGGVRVPLLIRAPGRTRAGSTCDEPVACYDLHATLAELAGLPTEEKSHGDGASLVPLFDGQLGQLDRDALYFHYPHYYPTTTPVSAVRARDWKLIEYLEDGRVELYQIVDDLGERRDLAEHEPGRRDQLRRQLDAWRRSVHVQMPQPNPDFVPGDG